MPEPRRRRGGGGGGREDSIGELAIAKAFAELAKNIGGALGTLISSRSPEIVAELKNMLGTKTLAEVMTQAATMAFILVGSDIPRSALVGAFEGLARTLGDGSAAPTDPEQRSQWVGSRVSDAFKDIKKSILGGAALPQTFSVLKAIGQLEEDDQLEMASILGRIRLRHTPEEMKLLEDGMRNNQVSTEQLKPIVVMPLAADQEFYLLLLLKPAPSLEKKTIEAGHHLVAEVRKALHTKEGDELVAAINVSAGQRQTTNEVQHEVIQFQPPPPKAGLWAWFVRVLFD